ncbi:hypothetical protein FRC19_005182 [Serendipita sp. 401]|nr:hypothetical protein FRC19_005182 [Serendipita sp. 401]
MDNTPWLDYSDQWDPSRVRLADVNGNGLTDLIYLGSNGISIHFNEHGNRWASAFVLSVFPVVDNWSSIQVADILGNGTACLVWSTSISPNNHQMKYIDLMGGTKPNLLVSMVNNLGIETHVHYASSTKFYLVDKVAGTPWITRIPFPTQVIERIETIDRIGRTYHSCRYVYHHGFYDGLEREMCGFGMVEAYDVEHFDVLDGVSISSTPVSSQPTLPPVNLDPTSSIPPVLTKSWFHTGVWRGDDHISRYLGHEYWEEPGLGFQQLRSMHLPDTNLPSGISLRDGSIVPYSPFAMEAREACRALRGTTIRVEVYTLDGTAKQALPYSVSEANFSINLLQPIASTNQNAVFMVLPREQISFSYDRYTIAPFLGGPEYCSPRVAHTMALEVDRFGNVTKSASIEYGQRHPEPDPHNILTPADKAKQTSPLLTYQETDVTNAIDSPDTYHLPLPSETRTYELLKIRVDGNDPLITNLYPMSTIKSQLALLKDGTHDLPFEEHAGQGAIENHPYRRLIGRSRSLYRKDDFTGPLPLGQLGLRALEYESYSQAFTPETLIAAFVDTGKLPSVAELERIMKEEAKYVHSEGDRNWWIPSGRVFFSSSPSDTPAEELSYAMEHFFLPLRFRDPFYATNFNTESSVVYDKYDLLPIELVDALQNRISAGERNPDPTKPFLRSGVDYRLLMTSVVMDPNDNVTAFAFDILGLVSGVAVMGKPGQNDGDSLDGFLADLSDAEVAAYFADPVGNGPALLENATSRTIFDVHAYYRTRSQPDSSPAVAASLTRETHVSDLPQDTTSTIQHSFAYSDGVGRVIQNKIRGEPGVVPQRDPATDKIIVSTDGQPILTDAPVDPRWIASGWTIFNNKGLPVRQYEPFFTDRLSFEFDVRIGVSPIIFYDAVGRNIGVANPNHTWSKVVANPWRQETWDLNDTALVSDPRTDPDLGGHFSLLPDDDYLPTWSTAREGGALGTEQQQCAQKTAGQFLRLCTIGSNTEMLHLVIPRSRNSIPCE